LIIRYIYKKIKAHNNLTMKKVNKNNNILESLETMGNLTDTIKEETKRTLKDLMSEAVKNYMNEEIIGEAEEDENEYEVEDVEDDVTTEEPAETETDDTEIDAEVEDGDTDEVELDTEVEDEVPAETESEEGAVENETDDDEEWGFDDYKNEDGDYDFTGVEDEETIVKVFKKLNNKDEVVIKQNDNKIELKDNETGAEYMIDVDGDEEGEEEFELEIDDDELTESVNLGYTDNYQDEDVMTNDGMNEPGKGKSWDEGAPKGTEKPWAKKGDSKPFGCSTEVCEETEFEVELDDEDVVDEATSVSARDARTAGNKTHTSEPRRNNLPKGSKRVSANGTYDASVVEKIVKKYKVIEEENKQYKNYVEKFKNALQEAVVVNVSLGQIVKLFTENTTTAEEKQSIVNRFNDVKTINESKALYESIKRELNKEQKSSVVIEKRINATENKSNINETKVYVSNDIKNAIDLMKRMGC
jgi:hypothetical protein